MTSYEMHNHLQMINKRIQTNKVKSLRNDSWLEVKIYNKSKVYSQVYERGKIKTKVKIEKCKKNLRGTEISFIPDKDIFESIVFSPKKLYSFIKMKSVLVKGTKIFFSVDKELIDDKTPGDKTFFYPKIC